MFGPAAPSRMHVADVSVLFSIPLPRQCFTFRFQLLEFAFFVVLLI